LTAGPERARQSYRHEAFLWDGPADFVDGLLPFIEEGIDAGEAVLVAATPEHGEWLVEGLGSKASRVQLADITRLARNPARIIPACHQFLQEWSEPGRPARIVGEPLWEGQSPEEVLECQLHEALMNLAVDPETPLWALCPYDAGHLDSDVLAEASRSHPALATTASYQGSRSYHGHEHAQNLFAADLPPINGPGTEISLTRATLAAAVETVTLQGAAANLHSDQIVSLTGLVRRLTADSLHRGAAQATARIWDRPDALICEVADTTLIHDLLIGRHHPQPTEQDSVWLANQVCDLVQVRSQNRGTTIRIHIRKQP